ncbi:single-stranded DNA-binding protein [Microbacterium sp. NPDC089698]|uniref:single-stranded DNA-binding protein n=1 Tax=Microbacterium sp. NPDC089698 TaxID=3364200 RepID=UPI0038261961
MTATITIHGGLTAQPELRYSQNGTAIASGTIASTDRYLDKQTQEWKDGKSLYVRWSAFKDLAEHIAGSSLDKGVQVVITGKLHTRQYEDREGQKRTSTELDVIDFAVSLKRTTAQVTRAASTSPAAGRTQGAAGDEPWSTPGSQADAWSTPGSFGDDTPF